MPVKSIVLPTNLCQEKKYAGQSIYKKDFCFRHKLGRRGKEKLQSYTSLINKQQNIGETDSFSMQLPDHYKTNIQRKHSKQIKPTETAHAKEKTTDDNVEKFLEQVPQSLKKIEDAWNLEVDTGKRERGNLYGLAGKKLELLPRKTNANTLDRIKPPLLPGLSEWLSSANEHEKRVVHTFISRLSEANRPTVPSRPHSSPAGQLYLSGNQLIKTKAGSRATRRYSRATLSPSIAELTTTSLVPKPPTPPSAEVEVVPSPPKSPPCAASLCENLVQSEIENADDQDGEQEPIGEDVEKPETPPLKVSSRPGSVQVTAAPKVIEEPSRPQSVPIQRQQSPPASLSHNCNNCEPCQKKRLKKMIDKMSGKELASYSDLIEEKDENTMNTMCTKMYRPQHLLHHATDEDYFHHGGAFQNVKPRNKGYFTIHPQFVSENIVELKKLRKRHQKYFGESRIPLL